MIAKYYDSNVETEWRRLNDHWLEFETTYFHIVNTIPKGSKILDIGGGPGRYSFRLANEGYSVFLADLSEKNIEFARDYERESGIHLLGSEVMNATDLGSFKDNSFDAVLCLGPLYHLETDFLRSKCVKEIYRVTNHTGIIFTAFIAHYAPLYDFIKRDPYSIINSKDVIMQLYNTGWNLDKSSPGDFYIPFFAKPEEIESIFDDVDIERMFIFGCEGIYNQSESKLAELEPNVRNEWLRLGLSFSKTNMAIYSSEHIVYVGRKK